MVEISLWPRSPCGRDHPWATLPVAEFTCTPIIAIILDGDVDYTLSSRNTLLTYIPGASEAILKWGGMVNR